MLRPDPSSLPMTPGVYLYKDASGTIIYVGKARILRRRILSYFRKDGLSVKTKAMLSHAESLDFLTTATEKEALLLEASLIKKHHPHYNIALRDDKQYFLFRLNPNEHYPRLEIVRQARRDGARYFGPFTSAQDARNTWKLLHKTFGIRRCTDRGMRNRVRPCLYYHIGQCLAPCTHNVGEDRYRESVKAICALLDGDASALIQNLTDKMNKASEAMAYEEAMTFRDQIRAITKTVEQQAVILPGKRDTDCIGLYESDGGMTIGMVCVRHGAISGGRTYYWPDLRYEDAEELLSSFLAQYYAYQLPPPRILLPSNPASLTNGSQCRADQKRKECQEIPEKNIQDAVQKALGDIRWTEMDEARGCETGLCTPWSDHSSNETEEAFSVTALEEYLSERRKGTVRLLLPKTVLDVHLVDMAQANAREESRRRELSTPMNLLTRLQKHFGLAHPPRRIECVDVSHTQGSATRVGNIVYEDGVPAPHDYRIYAMPEGNDDYLTLATWVPKRLQSGPPWPDILLIDGGRGQIQAVLRALREAGKEELFPLAGIAKARTEDGAQDRRAGNVADRIFVPNRSNPLPFKAGSAELLLLQRIRDTAHHFAISRHRKARDKNALTSDLETLPGIGPKTAKALWAHFPTFAAMCQASEEELARIPGFGAKKAGNIVRALKKHPGTNPPLSDPSDDSRAGTNPANSKKMTNR
ncbi:MAG: excinuclease ABC subunit UvrC [Desulfovibrio sp.]|nr:excinuclease ABC subunit UvrC [Desulfovibrio sp.]